jgi:hypothetical protein
MQVSDHCLIAPYNQQMLRALDVQWTMLHSGLWNTLCRVQTGTGQKSGLTHVSKECFSFYK